MPNPILRELRQLRDYYKSASVMRSEGWGSLSMPDLVRFYPRWKINLGRDFAALENPLPWMPFSAIDFLESLLNKTLRVFEYGSGSSSIFFAKRAYKVVSVEHDASWAERVRNAAQTFRLTNLQVIDIAPRLLSHGASRDPTDPDNYASFDSHFLEHSFKDYASYVDRFATGSFDLVVIDGRARPSCFKHALPKIEVGGWIVLDNSERDEYRSVHRVLLGENWRRLEFNGPAPYGGGFWQSCMWQRLH